MSESQKEGDSEYIEKVRRRAHAIWLDQGQVHGRDEEHWRQAEHEIEAEDHAEAAPPAPDLKSATVSAKDADSRKTPEK